jgi:hypothetical protein
MNIRKMLYSRGLSLKSFFTIFNLIKCRLRFMVIPCEYIKNALFAMQRPHHRTQYPHECDAYHLRRGRDFSSTKKNVSAVSRDLNGGLGRSFEVSKLITQPHRRSKKYDTWAKK